MEKLINKKTAELFKKHASPEVQKHLGITFATKMIPIKDYCDVDGNIKRLVALGHHDLYEFRANCWDKFHLKIESQNASHQYQKDCFVTTESRKATKDDPGYKGSTFSTTEPCDAYSKGAEPITVGLP